MSKKYFLLIASLLLFTGVQAQEEAVVTVAKSQFKINVLLPGFVYEHAFSDKNTLYSELTSGFGYRSSDFNNESTFYFMPFIQEQFRHYYNLEKRAAKGKKTAFNSGNFMAVTAIYNFQSISTNKNFGEYVPSLTIAPVWGFQRTYRRKFNLDLNFGAGVNFDRYNTDLSIVANFSLGWVIGK
ncbi:hypothetical protein ACRASX_10405 [Flavobacterium sp. TMP13]|uniref:hypothetical protein n=1 Tax=Flavobacterium sp. TMP13 TaxID=3425950 RepID=UPI003D773C30